MAKADDQSGRSNTSPFVREDFAARFRRWSDRWGPRVLVALFVLVFLMLIFFRNVFIFVKPGQQGVLYSRLFGTDLFNAYTEGLTIIWPWNIMYIYDVRAQQVHDKFQVLSKDGLAISVDISIRFKPIRHSLPFLHVEIGPDYIEKVVKPEMQANLRILMGQYTPDEIYTSQGYIIRRTVESAMPELMERHIVLEDLLITSIALPPNVQEAIESKLRQQQAFLEYEFRLQREEKERDRKIIEAEGIQKFQTLVQDNPVNFSQYLRYLGIQATFALSTSHNAKVVVIGSGSNGLPLILNLPEQAATPIDGTNAPATTVPLDRSAVLPPVKSSSPPSANPVSDSAPRSVEQALQNFGVARPLP